MAIFIFFSIYTFVGKDFTPAVINEVQKESPAMSAGLKKNDVILFYTDGVTDTSNALGKRFDEEGLIKSFSKLCNKSLKSKEILNKIFKTLDEFAGKNRQLEYDASMIVFQID